MIDEREIITEVFDMIETEFTQEDVPNGKKATLLIKENGIPTMRFWFDTKPSMGADGGYYPCVDLLKTEILKAGTQPNIPGHCQAEPQSMECTNILAERGCPGGRQCISSQFDPRKHSRELPIFYEAQHDR